MQRILIHVVALSAIALSVSPARAAQPESGTSEDSRRAMRRFEIPAGPLGAALTRFGELAGIRLLVSSQTTGDLRTRGISGEFTPEQALSSLLLGTGLAWRRTGSDTIVLEKPETSSTDDAAIVLDAVRVEATRTASDEDRAFTTAGSSTHISREEIERFRGTSVGDIFQGTPGVLVGENRNSGGLDINIRGMQGQGRVPVTIDGSRQETTVWRGYAGVASRSYVDPDLIGGIDITKGPTLGAEGTGAIGGVVSMRTIGVEDVVREGNTFGLRARIASSGNNSGSPPPVGTFGGYNLMASGQVFYADCVYDCQPALPQSFAPQTGMDRPGLFDLKGFSGSLAAGKRFEHVDVVAGYAQRRQGNYYAGKDGPSAWVDMSDVRVRPFDTEVRPRREGASIFRAEEQVINSSFESSSALLKGKFYLPDEQQLELGYLRYDSDFGEMMPSRINAVGIWAPLRQWIPSDAGIDTYTARYRWQPPGSSRFDLRGNLWHTDMRSVINTPGVSLDSDVFEMTVNERYRRWGIDLANASSVNTNWGTLRLDYGITGQLERIAGGGRDGRRGEASLFASADWLFAENWTLQAGLRYSRFHSEDDNAIVVDTDDEACVDADGNGICDPLFYNARFGGAAPSLTLLWGITSSLQLYARYAEGLRMPSLFETTSGWSVSPSFDIDLKPEHAKNIEAGVNLLKDGLLVDGDRLRAKLAYFQNHTKDYLTRTPPNAWEAYDEYGEFDSFDFFRLRNIRSASFHGLELSGSWDIGPLFTELAGSYYTKIETCHEGSFRRYFCTDYGVPRSYVNNMIPPDWHASAIVCARLLQRRLTIGLRGTFMGERARLPAYDDAQFGYAPPVPWHSYELLDLFASYKAGEHIAVEFNIDNLTDQYYLDALGLGVLPAPGRTLRAGLTLSF